MLELVGDVRGLRVLDAGCGPGLCARELVARGAEVVGFDAARKWGASPGDGSATRALPASRPRPTALMREPGFTSFRLRKLLVQ